MNYHHFTGTTNSTGHGFHRGPIVQEVYSGLLPRAGNDDYQRSIEVSGEPTDLHRLSFAKQHGVAYERVVRR